MCGIQGYTQVFAIQATSSSALSVFKPPTMPIESLEEKSCTSKEGEHQEDRSGQPHSQRRRTPSAAANPPGLHTHPQQISKSEAPEEARFVTY